MNRMSFGGSKVGGGLAALGGPMKVSGAIQNGVKIFNQGRPGSTTNIVVNKVSSGLGMSGPSNHQNDLGFRAGNAISNFAKSVGGGSK